MIISVVVYLIFTGIICNLLKQAGASQARITATIFSNVAYCAVLLLTAAPAVVVTFYLITVAVAISNIAFFLGYSFNFNVKKPAARTQATSNVQAV